jgi:predicted nucleic acid-binding protein
MTDHPVKALYFDTSYLYRIYSVEPGHHAVKALLMETAEVVSAWHARAEFASILLRKRREGKDTPAFLDSLSAQFRQDQRDGLLRFLPLSEPVMLRLETTFSHAPKNTFLRAADALHLACAAENGFAKVYSNDRHLLAAASLFGLNAINVISPDSP